MNRARPPVTQTRSRPVVFKRTIRASWRPDPRQVVMIVAVKKGDGTLAGEVWGVEGGRVALIETADTVIIEPARRRLWVSETLVWDGPTPGGCSCNTPRALRGFRPERAQPA